MIPLSPVMLIAAAGALLDGARAEPGAARLFEQFVSGVGPMEATAARWDTAFVHHVGYWAHFDHRSGRSSWPLPSVAGCDELGEFARSRGVLSETGPEIGEIFLLWSPCKCRFVHAGIVLAAERFDVGGAEGGRYECHTIEGNVTSTGCVGGDRLARVRRILAPARGDRSVRWADLERRAVSTRWRAA